MPNGPDALFLDEPRQALCSRTDCPEGSEIDAGRFRIVLPPKERRGAICTTVGQSRLDHLAGLVRLLGHAVSKAGSGTVRHGRNPLPLQQAAKHLLFEPLSVAARRSRRATEKAMPPKNGMRPVHPGEVLREELRTLDLSANALSKALDVPANRITARQGGLISTPTGALPPNADPPREAHRGSSRAPPAERTAMLEDHLGADRDRHPVVVQLHPDRPVGVADDTEYVTVSTRTCPNLSATRVTTRHVAGR